MCGQIAKPLSRSGGGAWEWKFWVLLVLPLIGVPVALGARRRDRKAIPNRSVEPELLLSAWTLLNSTMRWASVQDCRIC